MAASSVSVAGFIAAQFEQQRKVVASLNKTRGEWGLRERLEHDDSASMRPPQNAGGMEGYQITTEGATDSGQGQTCVDTYEAACLQVRDWPRSARYCAQDSISSRRFSNRSLRA